MDEDKRQERIAWLVYWNETAQDSYAYGSIVSFAWDGRVIFKNEGMPPGFVIREWYSYSNYGARQTVPQLPLLEEGKRYHLRVVKRDEPNGGSFVRINCYDRRGALLKVQLLKENEGVLDYPAGAFRYTLQLVQSGARAVEFTRAEIVPEENWEDWRSTRIPEREDGRTRTVRW